VSFDSKESTMIIYFSDQLLSTCGLKYRVCQAFPLISCQIDQNNSLYPPIRVNFTGVQKLVPELNKAVVQKCAELTFSQIIDILQQTKNVEIDLESLGKIKCYDKILSYDSDSKVKKSPASNQKQTVHRLLDI